MNTEKQQQKQDKKARDNLKLTINRCKSDWSFGKIVSYRNAWHSLGLTDEQITRKYFPSEYEKQITFPELKEIFSDLHIELETAIWLRDNPPDLSYREDERELEELVDRSNAKVLDDMCDAHDAGVKHITTELVTTRLDEKPEPKAKHDLKPSPKESPNLSLFYFQKDCIADCLRAILVEMHRARMVIAGTGVGKTFIAGGIFRRLIDNNFKESKTLSLWPYIFVTKASIVEQTRRVFRTFFNLSSDDVMVINIDQLRSRFGELFVQEKIIIEDGYECIKWVWRPYINPLVIIWDECQGLKNVGSTQSQIAQSFNEIKDWTHQIFMSATPGTRVCEFKCFCVATRVLHDYGIAKQIPLTNEHWKDFSTKIAAPAEPIEHSPAAVDRLMDYMQLYISRVKGVRTQFKAINSYKMISFETKEDEKFYNEALENMRKKIDKAKSDDSMTAREVAICKLTAMLYFRMAAELVRARTLAKEMYEAVYKWNKAAVCGVSFKGTIMKITDILVNDYGIPRANISIIWGGGTKVNKKAKFKSDLMNSEELMAILEEEGVDFGALGLDNIEAKIEAEIDPKLKLGTQNLKQRQVEIDAFQSGQSLFCLFTLRAGGVGLSLHHTDELTKEKVRKKESGYAYEEDIPKIPTRQRVTILSPSWSAMELVQGLGRVPRLTSLSDTSQVMLFYKNTIEEKVARLVGLKLQCLKKVVRNPGEKWEDVIVDGKIYEELERRHELTYGKSNTTVKQIGDRTEIELLDNDEDDTLIDDINDTQESENEE